MGDYYLRGTRVLLLLFSLNSSRNPRVVFADSAGAAGFPVERGPEYASAGRVEKVVGPCRDCPLLSSSDNANTWPKVESPCRQSGKDRGHFGGTSVSLPRSVPAGQPISNAPAVAGAFSSSTRPQPMPVASPASTMAPIIAASLRRRGRTSDQQHHAEKPTSARRNGVAMRGEDSRSPANGIRNRHHLYPAQSHRFDNADIQAVSFSRPSVRYLVERACAWMVQRLTGAGARRRARLGSRTFPYSVVGQRNPISHGFDIQGTHHHSDRPAGGQRPNGR